LVLALAPAVALVAAAGLRAGVDAGKGAERSGKA
jgi:hypothetical protein